MPEPENNFIPAPSIDLAEPRPASPAAVAPVWHTVVLIVGVLAVSATGPSRINAHQGPIHRIATYATTAAAELIMLGWVLLGLRLRKTSFRSLLGANSLRVRSIAIDLGIAFLFWIGSLMVLGTVALAWAGIEAAITHRPLIGANGQPLPPDPAQKRSVETLAQVAPSNGEEIGAWILLCAIAGFVEETVFRGYLQRQFIAWGRGSAAVGVVFSALMFGAAHGYEGARAMFLIAVFGALFSLLAIFRRSLRPGMIAHFFQDFFVGLFLAFATAHHLI